MIQNQYDLIVVGCGFCGSVIARLAAEESKKRVLILEKRNHIAGNMYDEIDKSGILVQKYGPHIFHTEEDWIYEFISRFSNWYPYKTLYTVELDGKSIPAPFGFKAVKMLYSADKAECLIEKMKRLYSDRESVSVLELMDCPDADIAAFADMMYQKDYRPYAAKQWNLDPMELDRSVLERMPVLLSERDHYYDVKYELLPEKGYTEFFRSMLEHESIDIMLNTDACSFLEFDPGAGTCTRKGEVLTIPIVFTGALEDIFRSTDPLPYRSLWFDYKTMEMESYQPSAIQTYPQTHKYLRSTEYTKLMQHPPRGKTVVAFEYPVPYQKDAKLGREPYYPILTAQNTARNDIYLSLLGKTKNVFPCGRLADYKYYNMDSAIKRAFEAFDEIKSKFWR